MRAREFITENRNRYLEIEFVCVNKDVSGSTSPKDQDALFQALKQVPNIIVYRQDFDESEEHISGGKSMAVIIVKGGSATATKVRELAAQHGVMIDLTTHRDDRFIDRLYNDRVPAVTSWYDNSSPAVTENIEIPIGRGRANTSVPDILYHSLRGRTLNMSGGIDAYVPGNPQEWRELGSRFKQPIQGLVYLSNKPLDQSALAIDVHKLNPNLLRYTGQSEGYLIYGDNIPADAIIDVSRQEIDENDESVPVLKLRGFGPSEKTKEWVHKVESKFHNQDNSSWIIWNHEGNIIPLGKVETKDIAAYVQFKLVPSRDNRVELKWIAATPLRGGYGAKGMKIIQDLARQSGITLYGYARDEGVVPQSELIKFYKKQGFTFKDNSGNMEWSPSTDK